MVQDSLERVWGGEEGEKVRGESDEGRGGRYRRGNGNDGMNLKQVLS